MTFEENMARLESIAAELGGDGVPLARALELFQEGVACLRRASSELSRAEAQVALLVEQVDGVFTLRPMRDGGAGAASGAAQNAGAGDGGSTGRG